MSYRAEQPLSPFGAAIQQFKRPDIFGRIERPAWEKALQEAAREVGVPAADYYAASQLNAMAREPSRAFLALILCERLSRLEGGTCLDLTDEALCAWFTRLRIRMEDHRDLLDETAAAMTRETALFSEEGGDRVTPLVIGLAGRYLYTHKLLHAETSVVSDLRRLNLVQPEWDEEQIKEILRHISLKSPLRMSGSSFDTLFPEWHVMRLAPEQRMAAAVTALGGVSVVTGGPGTGKTSVVATILRLFVHLGLEPGQMALAAPTGRAANRMAESLDAALDSIERPDAADKALHADRPDPKTLHLLLGYRPSSNEFRHNESNPLAARLVIVDEASMVDLVLMGHLLRALRQGTFLVLLGDADQIPSVSSGSVFRDLIPAANGFSVQVHTALKNMDSSREYRAALKTYEKWEGGASCQVVRLTQSFRQRGGGAKVYALAQAVNRREPPPTADELDGLLETVMRPSRVRFLHAERLASDETALEPLIELVCRHFLEGFRRLVGEPFLSVDDDVERLNRIFEQFNRVRTLCLTNSGPAGADAVNRQFRNLMYPRRDAHYAGQPVMITANDYRRRLFNGDLGICLPFIDPNNPDYQPLAAVFKGEDGYRAFPVNQLGNAAPGYAMTVHKSQGTEADHVVLILPDREGPLLKKELIYTAVTRAKKSVLIYGSLPMLTMGAASVMKRTSALAPRLKESGG